MNTPSGRGSGTDRRNGERSNAQRASAQGASRDSVRGSENVRDAAPRTTDGETPLMSRIGNQGMQILLQPLLPPGATAPEKMAAGGAAPTAPGTPSAPNDGEPPGAEAMKRSMGLAFGHDFADVRMRTDESAARYAHAAGVRAYTQGDEIGFARGAYDPGSREGRTTIAHEFAHIAQRRGGNAGDALPAMPNAPMAEWQAGRAAATAVAGYRPRVSAYAGRGVLHDDPKAAPVKPDIVTTDDKEMLATAIKMLELHTDRTQRSGAVGIIVGLAMKAGPANADATQKVLELIKGAPVKDWELHYYAVMALQDWMSVDAYRAYDFLLYGRFFFADHSKDEMGSGLVQGPFQRWLHDGSGKWCIAYLQRKVTGSDILQANLAARIVADLLEMESSPEAQTHKANYAALRKMSRENGWESFGALGTASATPRIVTALGAMREQAAKLAQMIRLGPTNDPWEKSDLEALDNLFGGLSAMGELTRTSSTGTTVTLFSAVNREESEHRYLSENPKNNTAGLLEMARVYTIAADAGIHIIARTEFLHDNVRALDQLGGAAAADTAERLALFDLRHGYITAWLSITGQTFGADDRGLAESYNAELQLADLDFEEFDKAVAKRKFEKSRNRFLDYADTFEKGKKIFEGNNAISDQFFFTMRNALDKSTESLDKDLSITKFSQTIAVGFGPFQAGATIATRTYGRDDSNLAQSDLRIASDLATRTSLYGFRSAVFTVYATNLSVHNMMAKTDIGSADFRKALAKRLTDMRDEMVGFWNNSDFEGFMAKTDAYEQTLREVIDKLKDKAKEEFLFELVITIVAALVTEGAALAVRLAALSETLALARTARTISSMSTLFEVGVFTTSQLTMQNLFLGKEITGMRAVKAAATNLAFVGALKGVGKIVEPLAQGSPVRQLLMGHLIGFAGVSAVSATMTRIETGQWPDDVAAFLAQTAVTYLLIAGLHHSFQSLAAKPALESAAKTRLENLKTANEALYAKLREKVDTGNLSKSDFEAIRDERARLIDEAKAVAQVLKDGGAMSANDYAAIEKMAASATADAKGASFPLAATPKATDPAIKALPAPESVIELTRVGDSDTYVYDPSKPTTNIDAMLTRYTDKGYTVEGTPGLRRITDPSGRTRFLLSGTPVPSPKLLHGGKSDALTTANADPLERTTHLSGPELKTVRDALARINSEMETKLAAEYPDHTVLATLSLFVTHAASITPAWPIDAVRGAADAVKLESGIPYSAVHRLFLSVDPKTLPKLFADYHEISTSPKVSAAAKFLIADDLMPKNSVLLIDAVRKLKARGLEMPEGTDLRAIRGLLKQVQAMPQGWEAWFMGTAKDKRLDKLRTLSSLNDPRVVLPTNVTELLADISADVRPGINPLSGANGDAFVALLESQAGAGKFADPVLRTLYATKVDSLRLNVAMLQQGRALAHGEWETIVGRANEVRQTASFLLSGATIHASDRDVGPKGPLPNINLADATLPSGAKIDNAPTSKDVHIDLLFTESNGTLVATELTSAELGLPQEFDALDPLNPAYGSNIDWAVAEANKGKTNVRKFMQMLKIYQLNKLATSLGSAWSGQAANPTSLRIRAGDFSVKAARAIESLGFVMELNDGTRQTAAQVEARKKSK